MAALRRAPAAQQSSTPPAHTIRLATKLDKLWEARVGVTTFRTTMAFANATVIIGTHGKTLKGLNERDDGVYVLDALTGKVRTMIKPPGSGDLDVGGIAVDGDRVYFGTDNGWVVGASLSGNRLWSYQMQGKVRPAPALGDLNGDGQVDVVVGDEHGTLVALDGATGKRLWQAQTSENDYSAKGFIAAAAIADLDGDGKLDVVAGARDGVLTAYHGADGRVLWQAAHNSGMHASPQVADFDGDGRVEVLAAWSYSSLAVLDGETGNELWGQTLSQDDGGIEGLFGTPVPLPGAPGVLIAPVAWWGKEDGVVGVGPLDRAFKTFEDRVSASAVVTDLDNDGVLEAIIGTEKGALLALHADGGRAVLGTFPGGIEAPAMLADVDHDGRYELLVAARSGMLSCFRTGSTAKPFLARFRGNDAHNRGDLGAVHLGWTAAAAMARPTTGMGSSQGSIRLDYLRCCTALQQEAVRAPAPQNQLLLEVAGRCNELAAKGTPRADAMREVGRALGSQAPIPSECQ